MSAVEHWPDADQIQLDRSSALSDAIVRAVEAWVADVPRSTIERLVEEELGRYDRARITQFIPVLVERAVLARLRAAPAVVGA